MINNSSNFSAFIAISLALHLVILYLILFGVSLTPKPIVINDEVQILELLPISSINNVQTQKVHKNSTVKNEDAKFVEKNQSKPIVKEEIKQQKIEKPALDKAELKASEPLPELKNLKEAEDIKPEPIVDRPKVIKKEEAKKEVLTKNPVKESEIKQKIPTDKELTSLLKNLEEASEGKNEKSKERSNEKSDANYDAFGSLDQSKELSLTNDELIKQQILRHWNKPVASVTEDITVNIHLELLEDGTVKKANIIDAQCLSDNPVLCQSVKDSVMRAIKLASPLVNLQPEDYNSWQEIKINFHTKNK